MAQNEKTCAELRAEHAALLAFAESIANNTSGNLHGFYGGYVTRARHVVKQAGGELRKVGRYKAGEVEETPHPVYKDGRWQ
jgi:hypothetical protein